MESDYEVEKSSLKLAGDPHTDETKEAGEALHRRELCSTHRLS